MDLSVLPNNNHPDKFLCLDVKSLLVSSAALQARQWRNKVYLQRKNCLLVSTSARCKPHAQKAQKHRVTRQSLQMHRHTKRDRNNVIDDPKSSKLDSQVVVDKILSEHITPEILKSTIKTNPLYMDIAREEKTITNKKQPSWTIQDYDKQSPSPKMSLYMKENPNDLQYWLEDIYTPGYDSLLKKKEKEQKNTKFCKLFTFVALIVCIIIAIVTVTVLYS
ncbi:major intrinsically disordered NOTCH2-binding receptor 1-like [Mixophyes fleayi]|uniref:major intrinsically disordered NOTCH2-binding receptor 1-like n=1 Tax=Mixophyes fleayi TaxID=3061075 RepID=UPI003F4D960A